ncbi:MAG: hypothetical protein K0R51_1450 [Cytophagaceae bacterium]|nr:hypothetical protein [Cytophagaceae bacterium]
MDRQSTLKYYFILFSWCILLKTHHAYADVIWRTTSIGPSKSYVESLMAANLNNSSTHGMPEPIDIDGNGTEDLRIVWGIYDGGLGAPFSCTEGTVSSKNKIANCGIQKGVANPFEDCFLIGYNYTIIEPSSIGGYMNQTTSANGIVFGHLTKMFFTPYPSATCNGLSSRPAEAGGTLSGTFGTRFIRNGNMHMGWFKATDGIITELAWESIPYLPIRIGSKTSVLNQVPSSYVVVAGQVFIDANANCTKETTETSLVGTEVLVKNTSYKAIVGPSGYYAIYLPYQSGAVYELEVKGKSTYGTVSSCNQLILPAVTSAGQTLQKNIAITPSACANIDIKINALPLRRCFRSSFTVNYENTGTVVATNRQIKVALPQWVKAISSVPAWTSNINDTLTFNLSTINALSKGTITIIDSVVCEEEMIRGMDQCIKAFVTPSPTCAAGTIWDGPEVNVRGVCQAGILDLTLTNDGGSMTDSLSYRIVLNKELVREKKYKLAAGEKISIAIPAHGKTVHTEVDQSALHPVLKSKTFAMEGCGDFTEDVIYKGIIHTLSYVKEGNTESTVCTPILDSYDPNDKTAMPGEGYIEANKDIYYTIRFQNTGTASAIHVVIDDTLSANIDASSFQIVSSSHPQIMSNYLFQAGGKTFVKFTFYNINLVKKSTSESLSQGYVTFKISQKSDLSIGQQIKNKAYIYFDYNSAIITNETVHEIGAPLSDGILTVTQTLADQSACEGEEVSLIVTSQNEETYAWYKDEELLEGENQNSLSIPALNNSTAGFYSCRVIGVIDTVITSSDVALKTAAVCGVTGTTSDRQQDLVLLYPNPTKSDFYIQTKVQGVYSIMDTYGKLIHKGTLQEGLNPIQTSHPLKQGYYVITVETSTHTKTQSLVVQ